MKKVLVVPVKFQVLVFSIVCGRVSVKIEFTSATLSYVKPPLKQ